MNCEQEIAKIIYEAIRKQHTVAYTDSGITLIKDSALAVWNSYPDDQKDEMCRKVCELVRLVLEGGVEESSNKEKL